MAGAARSQPAHPLVAGCVRLVAPLALLITLLLFLQWPLRDLVGVGSTMANDAAQGLFALYVAVGVAHAQARGGHLTARGDLAGPAAPRWRRVAAAGLVLPWCLYLCGTSMPLAWQSIVQAERFPETLNPGYFLVKVALVVLPLLLSVQAARTLLRALRGS